MSHTSVLPNITDRNLKPEFINETPTPPQTQPEPQETPERGPEESVSFLRKNWIIIVLVVVAIILVIIVIWLLLRTSAAPAPPLPKRARNVNSSPPPQRTEESTEPSDPTHEDLVANKELVENVKVERVEIPPLDDEEEPEGEDEDSNSNRGLEPPAKTGAITPKIIELSD